MANDPNRDILPVKETLDRGPCDRIEPHLVSRYRRPDLEDKFIKLYEENIELKRLSTIQDGKIKKLGTKLARHLRDKNGTYFTDRSAGDAELEIKVRELEHENYALKDKNIVLKQQLASHSRQHMAAHRSPVVYHRAPSSARLSQRQVSVPNMHDETYTMSNHHSSSELHLHDAEAHIAALNEEIKRLINENKSLRMEVEKTTLASHRNQDGENIELIKTRQQRKQLEAQLRVAEHNQKILKQDLARLQKEALLIVAERQNEVIDLQTKLDDVVRLNLEMQETKEIVADLTKERDLLMERCEALMATIREKSVDAAIHAELKKQLADAKSEATALRHELEMSKIPNIEVAARGSSKTSQKNDTFTQTQQLSEELNETWNTQPNSARSLPTLSESPYDIMQQLARSRNEVDKISSDNAPPDNSIEIPNATNSMVGNIYWATKAAPELNAAAERLNLQREADCLRDFLRAETQRCDLQNNQIMRLQQEMKLKEERYKDVFQQRDLFFRLLDKDSSRVQSARSIKIIEDEKLMDNEDSEDCPSQSTYVKQNGTYTKNSPTKSPEKEPKVILEVQEKMIVEAKTPPPIPVPRKRTDAVKPQITNSIQITILWLRLDDGCNIMTDSAISALYVDFTILSKSSENYETPRALPKPKNADQSLEYNFTAEIPWEEHLLQNLKELKENNPQGDCVIFNIVSEPLAEESISEVECPIVGISVVSFHQFAFAEEDEELLLPVFEMGKEKKCCGSLAVKLRVPASIFVQL